MKIAVIGTGYVGLVTGTCLAEIGHDVICVDISKEKIEGLKKGVVPIYEPGLEELIKRNTKEGRLSFTTNTSDSIKASGVVLSAVGTPMRENHEADLQYVKAVAEDFGKSINGYKIFVNKSTVPVGTGDLVTNIIKKHSNHEFGVVSNPEFLREGSAVKDFMTPDRIVVGCSSKKAEKIMEEIYRPIIRSQSPLIKTDIKSAELIKYAANSMLATRISFMNEIAQYADLVGADVKQVAHGIGLDERIGPRFLQAGIGYGGSCFPKDVQALIQSGKSVGYEFKILDATERVNQTQYKVVIDKLKKHLKNLKGKHIAIWGLSFKPKTDDVRDAPAAKVIRNLLKQGATVSAFDPVATEDFAKHYPQLKVNYVDNRYAVLKGVDALVLVTEWDEFRVIDYKKIIKLMSNSLIIDGRNIYDKGILENNQIQYENIGH